VRYFVFLASILTVLAKADDLPRVDFLRMIHNGGSEQIQVRCLGPSKLYICDVIRKKNDLELSRESISSRKMEEVITKFFKAVPKEELRKPAEKLPETYVFIWDISDGKKMSKGSLLPSEITRKLESSRNKLIEAVLTLESDLTFLK